MDNVMGISPKPHPAWLSLPCSHKEQPEEKFEAGSARSSTDKPQLQILDVEPRKAKEEGSWPGNASARGLVAQVYTGAGLCHLESGGEVRKVNREVGKLTLRHGPLVNLDMPAMTMVFGVGDPKLLDGLKEGDKVRFTADKKDGKLVVTAIERAS